MRAQGEAALAMFAHRTDASHELAEEAALGRCLLRLCHRLLPPHDPTPGPLLLLLVDRQIWLSCKKRQ
jgi:hypothetical protein